MAPFRGCTIWDNVMEPSQESTKVTVNRPLRFLLQIIGLGIIAIIAAVISACAVAQSTADHSWSKQIDLAPKRHQSKEDISQILGHKPIKCENIPGKPTVGILLRHDSRTTILEIYPNSPAAGTGLKVGDKILTVNSKPVHSMEDVIASTVGIEGPNTPITIQTQRGSYVVTPTYPTESEQCYWEVIGDKVGPDVGGRTPRGTMHRQYFRATCRFTDGKAYICHPQWQE
jgi:membrane-associated protease RseP (regulator of RpoE activity)